MVVRNLANYLASYVEIAYCWTSCPQKRRSWYEFAPKGYIPLSDFSKKWHGEGSPRFAPSRQILPFWLSKCGLTAQKIAKNANLWYTFAPKGVYSLRRFLQNFAWGREPQDRTIVQNFNIVALKLWPYSTKNRQKW